MRLWWIAPTGSAALLIGALAFQYIGDLPPCDMCIWQRWPHVAAVLIGALFFMTAAPAFLFLGALAALSTAAIGIYHVGVERGIFEGPDTCTSAPIGDQSTEELLNSILTAPLVRCDEIAWSMAGISMAGWNAIISLGLTLIWLWAWWRLRAVRA